MEDAALITAWATVAIAFVAGGGAAATCFLIWRGILEMRRSSTERAKDREEAREADLRRYVERAVMPSRRRRLANCIYPRTG